MTAQHHITASIGSDPCNTMGVDSPEFQLVANLVPEDQRLSFLPSVFGPRLMLRGESLVFGWMRKLCSGYSGGMWNFYTLTNGGFYLAPSLQGPLKLSVSSNGYSGEMSPDAAGVVITLYALGQLMAEVEEGTDECDALIERYYFLRDFAAIHPEAKAIFRAID